MSSLEVGLVLLAGTTAVSWGGWASVTLIRILQGISGHDTTLEDHERRLTEGGL